MDYVSTLSFWRPCFQINRPPGCAWTVKTIPKILAWYRSQGCHLCHLGMSSATQLPMSPSSEERWPLSKVRVFFKAERWSYGPGDRKQIFTSFPKHLERAIPVAWCFRKKIWRTCAVSVFSFLAISSLRDRGMECYWDQGVGTRKTNAQPSLPLPLSRSKNDCVGHEGFTFALSQSECQGKSRLTFLASGKKKQLRFMSTFCSANQGAEESVPGETFLLFII